MKASQNIQKKLVKCLYCDEHFSVGPNPKVGKFLQCVHCGEQFEIVKLNPVLIDWPYYDDDSMDDDDDFDDYGDDDY